MRCHTNAVSLVARRGLLPCILLVATTLVMGTSAAPRRSPNDDMAGAAAVFLGTLSPELRAKASIPFDGPGRLEWYFVPRDRPGVTLGEMNDAQRMAARALMRSSLSARGMLKGECIMALDSVLREMEKSAGGTGSMRDPLKYFVSVYGTPGGDGPWGWKLEGHHLSLNITAPAPGVTSVTPLFLGSNPAEVRKGDRAGERVLALEEDLARELLLSFDAQQRAVAVTSTDAPPDIITSLGHSLEEAAPAGLEVAKMNASQRALVERLLNEYTGALRDDLANAEMERIRAAGIEKIRFAWAGGSERGQPHYYRLTGPTFVIEYDNTQSGANHVHTVWHDRKRDFGLDALQQHYRREHAPPK